MDRFFEKEPENTKISKYEELLRWHLEKKGLKVIPQFKIEYPWGINTYDLAIPDFKLLIEVDGSQHKEDTRQKKIDTLRKRTAHLEGWRILHFTNNQVFEKMALVLERIMRYRPEGSRGI